VDPGAGAGAVARPATTKADRRDGAGKDGHPTTTAAARPAAREVPVGAATSTAVRAGAEMSTAGRRVGGVIATRHRAAAGTTAAPGKTDPLGDSSDAARMTTVRRAGASVRGAAPVRAAGAGSATTIVDPDRHPVPGPAGSVPAGPARGAGAALAVALTVAASSAADPVLGPAGPTAPASVRTRNASCCSVAMPSWRRCGPAARSAA
jgi:hypothetical protein